MPDLRILVIPAVLIAAIIGYIALNPSGVGIEAIPTRTATPTPRPTFTPLPTPTPVPVTLDLSGTLVWRVVDTRLSIREKIAPDRNPGLRAIQFPSGEAVRPPELAEDASNRSYDGMWAREVDPFSPGLTFRARDGRVSQFDLQGDTPVGGQWAPASQAFAIGSHDAANPDFAPFANKIFVIEDPAAPTPVVVYSAPPGSFASAFAWHNDKLVVAVHDDTGTHIEVVALDGAQRPLADTALGAGDVRELLASPDGRTYAFVIEDSTGSRLTTFDALTSIVTNHGAIDAKPREAVPCIHDPLAPLPPAPGWTSMVWSPDGSKLSFVRPGGPPSTIIMVELATGAVSSTALAQGSPVEVTWSPNSASIAVTTYDFDARRHAVWVVDSATGAGRHLIDGCAMVWSPDSRFIAVHGNDPPGVAIIAAGTGEGLQITNHPNDEPRAWSP